MSVCWPHFWLCWKYDDRMVDIPLPSSSNAHPHIRIQHNRIFYIYIFSLRLSQGFFEGCFEGYFEGFFGDSLGSWGYFWGFIRYNLRFWDFLGIVTIQFAFFGINLRFFRIFRDLSGSFGIIWNFWIFFRDFLSTIRIFLWFFSIY